MACAERDALAYRLGNYGPSQAILRVIVGIEPVVGRVRNYKRKHGRTSATATAFERRVFVSSRSFLVTEDERDKAAWTIATLGAGCAAASFKTLQPRSRVHARRRIGVGASRSPCASSASSRALMSVSSSAFK
jgi:hypothetical protein